MSNITTILIVVLLIAYVLFHLNSGRSKHVEEKAYQWWYMPLFALLFVGLMYLIYNKTNFPEWPIIRRIFDEYKVEGVFFLLCAGIWTALEYFLLRSEDIHNKLIVWYRNLFADKRDDKERVLPFPYFIDEKGEVRSRVGQVFYRWTMKMFIILIAVVYIAFYILAAYAHIEFYLKSALALLALLPWWITMFIFVPMQKRKARTMTMTTNAFTATLTNFGNFMWTRLTIIRWLGSAR